MAKDLTRKKSKFWVPQNKDCGFYNKKLFYLITDKFDGELLTQRPEKREISEDFIILLPSIIEFSELIQKLDLTRLLNDDQHYTGWFLSKTESWYEAVPKQVVNKYAVNSLLDIVKKGSPKLQKRPRHGDFTPWHLIKLPEKSLGLIDGEHTMANGVEHYDLGYFIQRVFSVLEDQVLAKNILSILIKRNYDIEKLTAILAARGIGGFLDESLKPLPNYKISNKFKNWVLDLKFT